MKWSQRYGDGKLYRKTCAIAHRNTHSRCCLCMGKSEQLHHSRYKGKGDRVGINLFPVCQRCHFQHCHHPQNWVKDPRNPVWGNHNTSAFEKRLQLGYSLLYKGIR